MVPGTAAHSSVVSVLTAALSVGAGGIGLVLAEMIRTLEWQAVSLIVLLILGMVALIDAVSGMLRRRLIGATSRG